MRTHGKSQRIQLLADGHIKTLIPGYIIFAKKER